MNKKVILILVSLILIALVGGGAFWFGRQSAPQVRLPEEPTPTLTPTPTPTVVPEETPTPVEGASDLERIKKLFAEKYDKPLGEVNISISENTGTHATGSVSFAGEMGGAMWLAYNDGEAWLLVFDGHGTIPCSAVDPYDFPTDMVPECWDEDTGKLIER